jgi:hypothetical protein
LILSEVIEEVISPAELAGEVERATEYTVMFAGSLFD